MEKETNEKIKKDNFYMKNYRWINISIIITITAIIVFSIKGFTPFLNQFSNAFKGKGFFENYLGWKPEIKFWERVKNFFTIEGFKSIFIPISKIIFSKAFIFVAPTIPILLFLRKKRIFRKVKLETEEDIREHYNRLTVKISLKIRGYWKITKGYIALGFLYIWHLIRFRDEEGKLYIVKYSAYIFLTVLFFNGNFMLLGRDLIYFIKQYFGLITLNIDANYFLGIYGFGSFVLYGILSLLTFWKVLILIPFLYIYLTVKGADRKKEKQYIAFRDWVKSMPMVIHFTGEIEAGKTIIAIATIIAAELNKIDFFREKMREIELRFSKTIDFKRFKNDFLDAFHKEIINTPIEAWEWSVSYIKDYDGEDLSNYTYNDFRHFGLVLEDQMFIYGPAYYNLLLATRIHSNINVYNINGFTDELVHYVKKYVEPRKDLFITVGTDEEIESRRRSIINSILNDEPIEVSAKIINIDILRGNQVGDKSAYYFASFGGISTLMSEIDKENPSKDSDVTGHQEWHRQASTTRHEAVLGPFNIAKHVEESQNYNASEAQTRGAKGFMNEILSRLHKMFFNIKILHKIVNRLLKRNENKIVELLKVRDDNPYYLEKLEKRSSLLLKLKDFLEQYDFFEYRITTVDAYTNSPVRGMTNQKVCISLDNFKLYNTAALNSSFISRARSSEIIERDVPHYNNLKMKPEEGVLQNSKMLDNVNSKSGVKLLNTETGKLEDYFEKVKDRRYSSSEEKAYQERLKEEEKERLKLEKEKNK